VSGVYLFIYFFFLSLHIHFISFLMYIIKEQFISFLNNVYSFILETVIYQRISLQQKLEGKFLEKNHVCELAFM